MKTPIIIKSTKVKGIVLSLVALLLVAGIMGTVYARTNGINNQNTFSDNSIDLKLSDQDETTWRDGVTATWTATNMAPGDEFAFAGSFVGLRSDSPGKVEITCNWTGWNPEDPDPMAKYMVITRLIYHDEEYQVQDFDGDGRVTFYDLKHSPVTNLPMPPRAQGTRFEMSVKFHEDAGNKFQGDTFNLTMIFTLKSVPAKGKS